MIASIEYRFTLESDDWKRAADAAEATVALPRLWRIPGGLGLLVFGVALTVFGVSVTISLFASSVGARLGMFILVFGTAVIWASYIAAWRPLLRDLQYVALLRKGSVVHVAILRTGIAVSVGDQNKEFKWGNVRFIIEGC